MATVMAALRPHRAARRVVLFEEDVQKLFIAHHGGVKGDLERPKSNVQTSARHRGEAHGKRERGAHAKCHRLRAPRRTWRPSVWPSPSHTVRYVGLGVEPPV